jgi:hypothetical protein
MIYHTCGLAIYIKMYLKAKKRRKIYGNSNISPCKNINLQKNPQKKKRKKKPQNPKSFKIL